MIYAGIFGLSLLSFFAFQNNLVMKNMTSNEQLRRKWNGRNDRQRQISRNMPGLCQRLRYFYWGELPKSRVEEFFKLKNDEESLIYH